MRGDRTAIAAYTLAAVALVAMVLSMWWIARRVACPAGAGFAAIGAAAYPCQLESGVLRAVSLDATDKGGNPNLDQAKLTGLEWFSFNVTQSALSSIKPTLELLAPTTKIALHPNISDQSVFGSGDGPSDWAASLAGICSSSGLEAELVRMIVFESESCDPLYLQTLCIPGGDTKCVAQQSWFTYKYADLLAAFKASFPNLQANGLSEWGTDPIVFTHAEGPSLYPNIWLEAYNIWSGPKCNKCAQSPGCMVDFNSTVKCGDAGGLDFLGAQCGPGEYACPALACPVGVKGCATKVRCDASRAYGGGTYDPTVGGWSAYERGGWFGSILTSYWNNKAVLAGATFGPLDGQIQRFVYFPFTDASCPTLYGVIRTSTDFDLFVQGFKDQLIAGGVMTAVQLSQLTYGAWGVPAWLQST